MKKSLLLISFCFISFSIFSQNQEVLTTQGGYTEFDNGESMSWTLGEIAIETISNDELTLTQGFQQSTLSYTVISTSVNSALQIELSVFPNPTSEVLNLKSEIAPDMKYQLFDKSGKMVLFNDIENTTETINMAELKASTYILRVIQNQEQLKSFQIIKK